MNYVYNFQTFHNKELLTEAKKVKSDQLQDNDRSVLLMDGTGSAGKSYTLKQVNAKKPNKGEEVGENDYEVIAKDDFFPAGNSDDMTDPNDPVNKARWELDKKAGVPD